MNIIYILIVAIVSVLITWLFLKNGYVELLAAANAKLEVSDTLVTALKNDIEQLKSDIKEKTEAFNFSSRQVAEFTADNRALTEKLNTQKSEIEALYKQFHTEFENMANKILEEKTLKFTNVNAEKLAVILNPLKEKIVTFEKKVEETYNSETREKATLRKELEQIIQINRQMSDDAQRLTSALKGDKKLQGDWGEMQVEQLLEKSGLQKGIHYSKQENFKTDDLADLRPDYVINLPDSKHYIIDSKVSLVGYERYFNTEDEDAKSKFLKEHIDCIDRHIDFLSRKNYQDLTNSPDFVFMFFALEPALFTALQNDLNLFDRALKKNIILVSNTTLLASLRTTSFIWRQENQKNNVLEIAKLGGQLYDKFTGFVENLTKVGQNIDAAKERYSEAMNQLVKYNANGEYNAGTIIGQAENLKKLGAKATKSLPQNLIDKALIE
jgi:DNA recombination protein RmuC